MSIPLPEVQIGGIYVYWGEEPIDFEIFRIRSFEHDFLYSYDVIAAYGTVYDSSFSTGGLFHRNLQPANKLMLLLYK